MNVLLFKDLGMVMYLNRLENGSVVHPEQSSLPHFAQGNQFILEVPKGLSGLRLNQKLTGQS